MQKKYVYLILLIVAAFFGYYFFQKYRVAPELSTVDLPLQTPEGAVAKLDQYLGKKTILCFSASWCGPCRAELKTLAGLKQSTLKDVNIVVISDEQQTELVQFRSGYPPAFEWLNLMQPFSAIGINSIPTSYLLNKQGKVVHQKVGYIDWEDPSTLNYMLGLME